MIDSHLSLHKTMREFFYQHGIEDGDLLDAYFDGRESKAVYTVAISEALGGFRSAGDKV